MPVIGLNFKSIQARKNEDIITGAIRVNSIMNVVNAKEQEMPLLNRKGASIEFKFKTTYTSEKNNKSLGEIDIDGNVVFIGDEVEEILSEWKKDKKLPEDAMFQIRFIVNDKCFKKALNLSDDLQLPSPPVLMPQAIKKENKQTKQEK